MRNPLFIESVARGMRVLTFIANSSEPVRLSTVSKSVGLNIGAVQRAIYTLLELGYLKKDEATQGYALAHKSWALGTVLVKRIDIVQVAHPYLTKLSQEVGETVNLAILDGQEIVYLDRVKTKQIINIALDPGSRLPAHCTSLGKAILAHLPREELLQIISNMELSPFTRFTITSKSTLIEALSEIQKQGFSVSNKELDIGLRSVAAPLRSKNSNVIAAINIAVPSSRIKLKELRTHLAPKVVGVAKIISESLGFQADV